MQSTIHVENKASEQQSHDCSECAVLTYENEIICIKCGVFLEEETALYLHENGFSDVEGRAVNRVNHNAGSGLQNSQTVQAGYVSRANPGVAFSLNNPRGKDFQGKKIKPQLQDPYRSGLLADPSKGVHLEEDILTGKKKIKFSQYDLPTLQVIKEKTLQECTHYGLDVVEQTLISKEVKRLYSNLVLTDIVEYIKLVSLLKYRHSIPKANVVELEMRLATCIAAIREKVVTCCACKAERE